jgi:hypothetical protein
MTARLTHSELQITETAYNALIWVRDRLDNLGTLPGWMEFDMDRWGAPEPCDIRHGYTTLGECGTAFCIGGSMQMWIAGLTECDEDEPLTEALAWRMKDIQHHHGLGANARDNPLCQLFFDYPMTGQVDYRTGEKCADHEPTPAEAVAAIDRFLAGNRWNPWLIPTWALGDYARDMVDSEAI